MLTDKVSKLESVGVANEPSLHNRWGLLFCFGDDYMINNIAKGSICVYRQMSELEFRRGNLDFSESVPRIPIRGPWRWISWEEGRQTLGLPCVTNNELKVSRSILVGFGLKSAVANGISPFIVMNMSRFPKKLFSK